MELKNATVIIPLCEFDKLREVVKRAEEEPENARGKRLDDAIELLVDALKEPPPQDVRSAIEHSLRAIFDYLGTTAEREYPHLFGAERKSI